MIPNLNFNPSFANLAALRGLGGMPHPIPPFGEPPMHGPVTGGPSPMPGPLPGPGMPIQSPMTPPIQMTGQDPNYPGMPPSMGLPGMQFPHNNMMNLHALMQLLGQQ